MCRLPAPGLCPHPRPPPLAPSEAQSLSWPLVHLPAALWSPGVLAPWLQWGAPGRRAHGACSQQGGGLLPLSGRSVGCLQAWAAGPTPGAQEPGPDLPLPFPPFCGLRPGLRGLTPGSASSGSTPPPNPAAGPAPIICKESRRCVKGTSHGFHVRTFSGGRVARGGGLWVVMLSWPLSYPTGQPLTLVGRSPPPRTFPSNPSWL